MKRHVVVVDDAETNLAILEAIVSERHDTDVHPFGSSRDALAFADTHHVDAFILDYHMPEPNGPQMIAILRIDPRFEYTPIVIVTGEHDRESRMLALAAGANDYIERPIEPRELLARLETLLTLHGARERLSDDVRELAHSLRLQERHSREQAERMVALWRIVTNTELATEDIPHAILFEGARAIRPPQAFNGSLQRIDGENVILEAKTRIRSSGAEQWRVGTSRPLAETIASLFAGTSTTRAWNDVRDDPESVTIDQKSNRDCRARICTSFYAGRQHYLLEFWSSDPVTEPFTSEDFTYIELLASFFSARMQQAWQLDRISHHLSHDTLTGLRNRTQFRLDARAALDTTGSGTMAVVSLDGFHHVNETYGHIIGDALLVEVAAALERRALGDEVVARLAGDNFGLFLPGIADEESAKVRLAMFASAFENGFSTGDREGKEFIRLSATIGASLGAKDTATVDTLLSQAHTAAFAARRTGRGKTLIFEPHMEPEEVVRDRRLSELAMALDRDEFEMYFQPHIDLTTNEVAGAEALIRWNHPTRGTVSPEEFIPFAEQHGFIRPISMWVMQASLDAAERIRQIDPKLRVYFNLSAHDLADMEVVNAFREAAARGVHLENVGVELTESAAMRDIGIATQTVKALQDLGVRVAIDDFGTGYSSLSLLKRLPVDIVKIDRTFVSEVLLGERDAAIAEAVIGFGEQFGFETLGEGVENAEQLSWLGERKCRYAQGYTIAYPQPIDAFVDWLDGYRKERDMANGAVA